MKRFEHLLTCLAEECCETAHRVSKALRFGMDEVMEGSVLSNHEKLLQELIDIYSVVVILQDEGILAEFEVTEEIVARKREKIERYMKISKVQGVLQDE